jgi:cyclic beta-1,2-glucan synthetase
LISALLNTPWRRSRLPLWASDTPIREELFSVERLEQHAETLAAAQAISPIPAKVPSLARRLRANATMLLGSHRIIAKALDQGRAITPAAEWLVDNYHIVEEQIREVQTDLPPGYYRLLPKLATGPFAGYPRVFGIAWAYVAHTDSFFDPSVLRRFIDAYQRVQPLAIGELWAVAITLRIVLIENLRRSAARIIQARAGRQEADALADRLLGTNGHKAESIFAVLNSYETRPLPPALAVQLVQRLRDLDPRTTPAVEWLETHLARQQTSPDVIVHEEQQRQGASNVTVRNIITSMRLVSDIDWTEFVESVSLVDAELRANSSFAEMDFPTRNLYRDAVEELARGSQDTELDITRFAIAEAARSRSKLAANPDPSSLKDSRHCDPGYYLIADGRESLEAVIGFKARVRLRIRRFARGMGISGYVASIYLVAAVLLTLSLIVIHSYAIDGWTIFLLGCLGWVPAMELATALVNRDLTKGFGPTILPGLELPDGVPAHLSAMVVVPTLLISKESIAAQIENLEIYYLTSPKGEVYFALLSDWIDAAAEHATDDDALLEAARAGIADLNRRYAAAVGERFFLLHRRRVWNEAQGKWIGWERKRGKLHELNRLLRGGADTTFLTKAEIPAGIRYVITLDADTKVPREAVRRLIGKMAHPLNRPLFDPSVGRVVDGYAVLQPRITPSLPTGYEGSLFQLIVSSPGGIDPYAAAVSDLYQDLFGEGSYTGKGIYEIDAFEAALAGRIPENTVLSHDLLEGIFARAGLASDIEFVEEFPARYDVAAARQHRWARGDWQLLPWILGGRRTGKTPDQHAMPLVGMWKMADNLRRTLVAPMTVAALLVGWTLPIHVAGIWSLFLLATIAIPALAPVISTIIPRRLDISPLNHMHAFAADMRLTLLQVAIQMVFLGHQAWLMADAILRTIYRLFVSHRLLLEWTATAQTTIGPKPTIPGFTRRMFGGPVVAAITLVVLWRAGSNAWPVATPFVLAWLLSPAIAYWVSRSPRDAGDLPIGDADTRALRLIARRTWRYFETFVTAVDRQLPPDNFQEDPRAVLAHRTSPTNLGLYLLSAVSARDFGWSGIGDASARLAATLVTMDQLERFRGHFYNWYDTQDLRPLDPKYISTVDSGNLAGHLIALANACRGWRQRPFADQAQIRSGVEDGLELARDALLDYARHSEAGATAVEPLAQKLEVLAAGLAQTEAQETAAVLATLVPLASAAAKASQALMEEHGDAVADIEFWVDAMWRTVESHRRDLALSAMAQQALDSRLFGIEQTARRLAMAMRFDFLMDQERQLLSIGYLVAEGKLDSSCYDLLASEARLASLFAIAKGDVPTRHWFRLGRTVTPVGSGAALISWSGSMFEYLMPSLVMRAPFGSLLERTSSLIVQAQMRYAKRLSLPWGISESAYNVRDREFTYQYSSFGVPGLGLKRGLGESSVIAPYATALATMVDPAAAARNFSSLASIGGQGRYGYYEALDFTRKNLPGDKDVAIVRAFMSHHQGMTIVAIANALFGGVMRDRFHAEPMIQAAELLLQERTPRDVMLMRPKAEDIHTTAGHLDFGPATLRQLQSPHDVVPALHVLSNGRYSVMVTAAGSGYSRWNDMAVTRWREDITRDDWGSYIFLRDVQNDKVWSAGYQPMGVEADRYWISFSEDRAELVRRDGALTTSLEIVVSPEDDAEVRRLSISNAAGHAREIEITSYAELVLASPAADNAHQAFSKLFVQTEYLAESGALIATRRRRSPAEPEIWVAQIMVAEGDGWGALEVETDRAKFIGRGRNLRNGGNDARPGICPSATRKGAGTRLRPCDVLDDRCGVPAGIAESHRQAPGHQRLSARLDAGLDPGADSAATSQDRPRRSQYLSAAGESRHLRQWRLAAVERSDSTGQGIAAGPLAAWHFRRQADCPGSHR